MIADGLTKPLGPNKFAQFVKSLGLLTLESAREAAAKEAKPDGGGKAVEVAVEEMG